MNENQKKEYLKRYMDHTLLVLSWIWKYKKENPNDTEWFIEMFEKRSSSFVGNIIDAVYLQWVHDWKNSI